MLVVVLQLHYRSKWILEKMWSFTVAAPIGPLWTCWSGSNRTWSQRSMSSSSGRTRLTKTTSILRITAEWSWETRRWRTETSLWFWRTSTAPTPADTNVASERAARGAARGLHLNSSTASTWTFTTQVRWKQQRLRWIRGGSAVIYQRSGPVHIKYT